MFQRRRLILWVFLLTTLNFGFNVHLANFANAFTTTAIVKGSSENTVTSRTLLQYTYSRDPPFYDDDTTNTGATGTSITPSAYVQRSEFKVTTPSFSGSPTTITTLDDLYKVVQECRKYNLLLVIHWSAPWCKTCQRIAPLLHRTIVQLQQHQSKLSMNRTHGIHSYSSSSTTSKSVSGIRYINIPLLYSLSTAIATNTNQNNKQNQNLHALFQIHTVPYCHIYHPTEGLQHEFTITNSPKEDQRPSKRIKTNSKSIAALSSLLESYIL